MQWHCPHCGTSLAVSDESVGTGWSFSRCFQCAGFALIRRAEINIIKVDKAPPGERVLLAEATTGKTGLITESATQNLAQHSRKPPARPARAQGAPPQFIRSTDQSDLPQPLPEVPQKRNITMPIGIAVASTLTLFSGVFLYFQGVSISKKADTLSQLENRQLRTTASDFLPAADVQAKTNVTTTHTRPAPASIVTDQVQESAMAPLAPSEVSEPTPSVPHVQPGLHVEVKSDNISMHSGPGLQYPVLGVALPNVKYHVSDWRDRWFRLSPPKENLQAKSGWVRNDLVKVLSSSGIAAPKVDPLR